MPGFCDFEQVMFQFPYLQNGCKNIEPRILKLWLGHQRDRQWSVSVVASDFWVRVLGLRGGMYLSRVRGSPVWMAEVRLS